MSKHTPGPWLYGPFGAIWPASDVEFLDGKWREKCAEPRIIATPSPEVPEAEANARLIAAAPDMLEALMMLNKWFEITGSSVKQRWERIPAEDRVAIVAATKAAIAEAEGRS
ncbi:hypothetical protein [Ensifer sp. LBL]|uniref:hypothetical protein n=1 Tax=Ensifer sp. LBL TaxID=2991056 RepID=UPI003D1D6989